MSCLLEVGKPFKTMELCRARMERTLVVLRPALNTCRLAFCTPRGDRLMVQDAGAAPAAEVCFCVARIGQSARPFRGTAAVIAEVLAEGACVVPLRREGGRRMMYRRRVWVCRTPTVAAGPSASAEASSAAEASPVTALPSPPVSTSPRAPATPGRAAALPRSASPVRPR